MPRYEGMDEILQQVRHRLGVDEAVERADTARGQAIQLATPDGPFDRAVEGMILLMHDAEQLRRLLDPEQIRLLTSDQCAELRSVLARVQRELSAAMTQLE
jgi:hypothetical protein